MMRNAAEREVRCDLAAAHRLAVRDGLNEGAWNHLSVMSPDEPGVMFITPGYTHWSMVNASNLAAVGEDGEPVSEGGPVPSVAGFIIHMPVHQAIPGARCLMHVHAPYITALSMRKGVRLDTSSSQQAAQFCDDVAYYDSYDGLLVAEDEGLRMADAMDGRRVLMMRNHGAMVAGGTVGQAYVDLYQLERACMYQILATGDGYALEEIPPSIAAAIGRDARERPRSDRFFRAMRDVLDAGEPDYAA
ncbi:MAG: class II aldolase/adducin family protein [Alphaproteobacteria bacterium]|nr:class II aldolase/adducin family protein [Alphaproteobacteria bacterium]